MANLNDASAPKKSQNISTFESSERTEQKFWRKIKEDPVVPIGMAGFGMIVLGAIIGFNRRDRNKPTSTYWIRTRVYAQGFVVSLLTAAAIYHAVKDTPDSHNHHGHGHHHAHSSTHNHTSQSDHHHSK